MFVQQTKGEQLSKAQVSRWFTDTVLPPGYKFGPQKARAIFVTAARNKEMGCLNEAAAADAMGHCLTMWEAVYDRQAKHRAAEANVVLLAEWRAKVVAKAAAMEEVVDLTSDTEEAAGGAAAAAAAAGGAAAASEGEDESSDYMSCSDESSCSEESE